MKREAVSWTPISPPHNKDVLQEVVKGVGKAFLDIGRKLFSD